MRNTIVITGGAGYIGQALVKSLRNDCNFNKKIVVIDSGLFFQSHITIFNPCEKIQYFIVPLAKAIESSDLNWDDVETIIHLSGLSNDPMADFNPEANHKFNFLDTTKLIDKIILKYRIPKLVFASSASVYGMLDSYPLSESAPTNPAGQYGQTKLWAENYIDDVYQKHSDIRYVILRKATVMGVSPRMRFDLVVNTMVKDAMTNGVIKLLAGGENWRPLVAIDDVVNIYKKLIMMPCEEFLLHSNAIYNVVQDNYRISELALRVKDCMEKIGIIHEIEIDPGYDKLKDIRSYRMLGNSLEASLKYKPEKNLRQVVTDIVRWLLANCAKDVEDDIYYNIRWLKRNPKILEY